MGNIKEVATITFNEGRKYKEYEMNIFPKTKITIKKVANGASSTFFKGDIKDLMYILWKEKRNK